MAALSMLVASSASIGNASAANLNAKTTAAFERYVRLTEARMETELRGEVPFLWVDRLPEPDRRDAEARIRRGEVVVHRLQTREAGREIDIPDGICHHWIGTMFAAGAALEQTVTLMQTYDRYQDIYRPAVRRSRTISRDGDRFRVYLQLFMKKIISVVLNTEYDVRYLPVISNRMLVRSYTTRIAEVSDPDTADEREKPVGHDNGFLWRFNNYCGLEARSGGTYVQCESVSLSRDVPMGLGWLVRPFVTGIPKESLEFTLTAMRAALSKGR